MVEKAKSETLAHPFFVVGPLRSGTTLLRLLIGHHPKVNCFGEFEGAVSQAQGNDWPELKGYYYFVTHDRQAQEYNFTIDRTLSYEDLVRDFLQQLYERDPKPLIGASIHSRMDLLPRLWPGAKFIHLLRDPRDVARSCIGMGWVGNVYEGAKFWLDPEAHWDVLVSQVDSERCLTVRYEELVMDPERELTRVCDFLGLEYSPVMLDIEESTSYSRPDPKYASQWRKALTKKEILWVEDRCGDRMVERGYARSQHEAGRLGPASKILLKLHNRWARTLFNIQRYGIKNWMLFKLSRKVGSASFKASAQAAINRRKRELLK